MPNRIQFPSAIDMIRLINDNIVDNMLVKRTSYVQLPSLYQRAFAVVYETGELPIDDRIPAPDESTNKDLNPIDIPRGLRG
jgi:hypothetical protein